MRILLSGACGHMGAEVIRLSQDGYKNAKVVCGVDANPSDALPFPCYAKYTEVGTDADCIIDFSHHSATEKLLACAVKNRLPLVLATTGQTPEEKAMIEEASRQIPVFFAANFSLGIALLIELAKKTALTMEDAEIEIVEKHHDRKLDAPSGTALAIAQAIYDVRPESYPVTGRSGQHRRTPNEIGIHAIRMGNIVGEHEVLIGTQNETITLRHEAHSRALFAEGAITAAAFLVKQPAGLYSMQDMVRL